MHTYAYIHIIAYYFIKPNNCCFLLDVMVLKDLLEHVETASRRRSNLSLSVFSMQEEPLKDKLNRLLCSWECPGWFKKFQNAVGFIILDAFVDLFITICILVNTAFMAWDQYGLTEESKNFLENGNQVNKLQIQIFARVLFSRS